MAGKIITAIGIMACIVLALIGGYLWGRGSRISDIIAGNGELEAVELRYERALGKVLSDLADARRNIEAGSREAVELRGINDRLRRSLEARSLELEKYHRQSIDSIAERDRLIDELGEIGQELQNRSGKNGENSEGL